MNETGWGITRKWVCRSEHTGQIKVVNRVNCMYFKCFTLQLWYLGEGKKFYVLTKHVKKNTFLFSLGIFQSLIKSMGGKWVGFYCDSSVDSFYCDIVMLCTIVCRCTVDSLWSILSSTWVILEKLILTDLLNWVRVNHGQISMATRLSGQGTTSLVPYHTYIIFIIHSHTYIIFIIYILYIIGYSLSCCWAIVWGENHVCLHQGKPKMDPCGHLEMYEECHF